MFNHKVEHCLYGISGTFKCWRHSKFIARGWNGTIFTWFERTPILVSLSIMIRYMFDKIVVITSQVVAQVDVYALTLCLWVLKSSRLLVTSWLKLLQPGMFRCHGWLVVCTINGGYKIAWYLCLRDFSCRSRYNCIKFNLDDKTTYIFFHLTNPTVK